MEVTIKDNGRYGIDVASGGQMVISSTTGNRLTVSGNQTGDSQKNAGIGIHVAGVFDGTRSRLDIIDMATDYWKRLTLQEKGQKIAAQDEGCCLAHCKKRLRVSGSA
jgi:hypothetical protein